MPELNRPVVRTGNTAPITEGNQRSGIAPARPTSGPIQPAAPTPRLATNDRNRVAEAADPLDRAPRPVDLGALARTAGQLGQALEAASPLVDAAANTADAVAFSPDAIETAFAKLKPATPQGQAQLSAAVEGAQKAGRVLGVVGAAIAAKDLFDSVYPELDPAGAAEALCNFALGLATAGDELLRSPLANAALRTVGGVAGLASSLFALARDVQDLRANGASFTNVLGLLGNGITAVGSAMLLIPGLQAFAGATLMVGAALNVTRLAVENWDAIQRGAKVVTTKVGGWLASAQQWATGPPAEPVPARAPA